MRKLGMDTEAVSELARTLQTSAEALHGVEEMVRFAVRISNNPLKAALGPGAVILSNASAVLGAAATSPYGPQKAAG